MDKVELSSTRCAICGTTENATELYPANFELAALNPEIFSARRLPDRIHYRLVKCNACDLVRSDPVAGPEVLARLYAQSTFNYGEEVADLKRTYGRYLAKVDEFGVRKDALLEIGCGNGFFLETALDGGYRTVRGIEPGRAVVDSAPPRVREQIVCGMMGPGVFKRGEFDVVCLFQVFDHISNPGALLDECLTVLKPGGFVLAINHNIGAISARLLGERSPIVDIEHTYLYTPATMARLFRDHGFTVRRVRHVWNTYHLRYLIRLLPLPGGIKKTFLRWLADNALGRVRFRVPLGNLYLIAQKPGA